MRSAATFVMVALLSSSAWAGRGGSQTAITTAVESGSTDAIVAEIERAEYLACLGCIGVVQQLVDHPQQRVRDAAGWWLTRRGVRTEVIASMTARLTTGSDPIAARNAGDVLAAMRDYSTLPTLSSYLTHPLDEDSGVAVVKAIGAIGHPSSVATLSAALGSPLAGVRAQAAASLRDLRAPKGATVAAQVAPLLPLLTDSDVNTRHQAAVTIGYIAQGGGSVTGALAALTAIVNSDAAPAVRKSAAWAIGQLKDGSGRAALQQAQGDSDPLVRSVATTALANLR